MRITTFITALLVVALPVTAQAAFDTFIKIERDKTATRSTDGPGQSDWIPIAAYKMRDDGSVLVRELDKSSTKLQDMDSSGSAAAARTRGDTTLGDVVVRELDKSSTKLQESIATGQATSSPDTASAKLMEAAANGSTFARLTIARRVDGRMENVYVFEQVRTQANKSRRTSGDADDRPTEEVAFYYNKIAFAHPDTGSSATASKGGNAETEWKVEKGEK